MLSCFLLKNSKRAIVTDNYRFLLDSNVPYYNKWIGPLIVKNDWDSINGDQNLVNEKIFVCINIVCNINVCLMCNVVCVLQRLPSACGRWCWCLWWGWRTSPVRSDCCSSCRARARWSDSHWQVSAVPTYCSTASSLVSSELGRL